MTAILESGKMLVYPFDTEAGIGILHATDDYLWAVSACHYFPLHSKWVSLLNPDGSKYDVEGWVCSQVGCGVLVTSGKGLPDSSRLWIDSALHVQEWVEQWTGNPCGVRIEHDTGDEEAE